MPGCLRGLGRLRRRLAPGQQRLGLGALALGFLDQAPRLVGEPRLLRRRGHLVGLAARAREHVGLVGAALLGRATRLVGRPHGLRRGALGCGSIFHGLCLGLLEGACFRLGLGVLVALGPVGFRLLGRLRLALCVPLLGGSTLGGELFRHLVRGLAGHRGRSKNQRRCR